jgi:hypothetical protein
MRPGAVGLGGDAAAGLAKRTVFAGRDAGIKLKVAEVLAEAALIAGGSGVIKGDHQSAVGGKVDGIAGSVGGIEEDEMYVAMHVRAVAFFEGQSPARGLRRGPQGACQRKT